MIEVRKRLGILNNLKRGIGPILGYLAAYAALLLLVQKHLSATMLIMLVSGVLLLVGGINKKNVALLGSVAGGLVVAAIALEPFRMARILGFLHPEDDPNGKGFHVLQSWKALGSGEFFGLGLGMSRQKFGWLPENHTDFIMAIIGEESGFIGVILIIGLFLVFVIQGILISAKAPDRFGLLMGTGISSLIFFQAFINMAVVNGTFPVTGVPLPFISYGGTSTIILMIGIGLIFNIVSQTKK
jgi:cell division protein FtsW